MKFLALRLPFLWVLTWGHLLAQPYTYPVAPALGQVPEDFLPEGYHLLASTVGVLNSDEQEDLVVIAEYNHSVQEPLTLATGTPSPLSTPRILIVAYGNSAGGYQKILQHNAFILRRVEGGLADPFQGMVIDANGVLNLTFSRTLGDELWEATYKWQYRQDALHLIGAETLEYDAMRGKRHRSSYNFLPNKCKHTYDNAFNTRLRPQISWYTLHIPQLKKFSDFPRPLTWKIMEGFII